MADVPEMKGEQRVLDYLTDAHNTFVMLDREHPNEAEEWTAGMHKLQGLIAMRFARATHPEVFPRYSYDLEYGWVRTN
jgi:hypothetical protein